MQFQEFDLDLAVQAYADYLVGDYYKYSGMEISVVLFGNEQKGDGKYSIAFQNGKNYIKVLHVSQGGGRSAHSFIVKKADGKFKVGDILKASSWAAPAKNFARGNVISQNYGSISWAGA